MRYVHSYLSKDNFKTGIWEFKQVGKRNEKTINELFGKLVQNSFVFKGYCG